MHFDGLAAGRRNPAPQPASATGLDLMTSDGTVLKVYYAGQFGEDTEQQSTGVRASLPF